MHPRIFQHLILPVIHGIRHEPVDKCHAQLEVAQWYGSDRVEERQIERLNSVIESAVSLHPYYRTKIAASQPVVPKIRDRSDLARLPILDKDDLRHLVDHARSSNSRSRRHSIRLTGGSSGAPLAVVVDAQTSAWSLAARDLCQGWYGIRPGDRQARLWGRPLESAAISARAKDILLNRVRLDSTALLPGTAAQTLKRLQHLSVDYIYGYASLIQLFASSLPGRELSTRLSNLKAVITTSETMSEEQQRRLQERYDCPVANEYGCSEVDIIAFQCPEGGRHTIAENLIVEVVRTGDAPLGYGQVVITDLRNSLIPIIRYRLGDLAPLEMTKCSCGRGWPCIGPVIGRSQGQFIRLPGGQVVHSQFVVYMIEELIQRDMPIAQFRIIQESECCLSILVASRPGEALNLPAIRNYVTTEARRTLGFEIDIAVQETQVDFLERTRKNKYQHFESRLPA